MKITYPSQLPKIFLLVLWVWVGSSFAQNDTADTTQSSDPRVLAVCTRIFNTLRPQLLYIERANLDRFWIRAVMGVDGQPVAQLTLSIDLNPVPLGLEDVALQIIRPLVDRKRILNFVGPRFSSIGNGLSLGNWTVNEPKGYRCFLTFQGRVVGVIRLNERLAPRSDARWVNLYRRSPLRFPVDEPVIQSPP